MTKEYIKFYSKLKKYNPENILHIGGNTGQEGEIYKEFSSFTFVEPVKQFVEIIKAKGYNVIEAAVGLGSERDFYVDGQVSSFLKTKKQRKNDLIKVNVVPLSNIQSGYDVLVVDTEGSSLEVLKTGKLNFKAIIIELRDTPAFIGEATKAEVVEYLKNKGYKLVNSFHRDYLFEKIK